MFTITHDAFVDFIEAMPGLAPYAIDMYRQVDKRAERAGTLIVSETPSVAELRARPGTPFVQGVCRQIANALERDPTGRLAAIPALQAWATEPDGVGRHWINWYSVFLIAWLDQQAAPAPTLVPMMVEA